MLSRSSFLRSALASAVSAALPRPAAAPIEHGERFSLEHVELIRRGVDQVGEACAGIDLYADFQRQAMRQIAQAFAIAESELERDWGRTAYSAARLELESFAARAALEPLSISERPAAWVVESTPGPVPFARADQLSPGLGHCPSAEGDFARSGARRVGDAPPGSGANQKG